MNPELFWFFGVFFKTHCVVVCEEFVTGSVVVVIVRVGVFFFPLFALKKRWRNQKTNAKWNSCIPLCCKDGKPVSLNKNK